uniref:Uncharacterized protein n=1 Tax=Polytomella parva TaxID=51329 RepID=A0A7S0V0I5_9CHLO|mmetsp:Transcript_24452/g.43907  ORF Transcript_24452/g.43907 Transcript_24452/m.43907 type:complete len:101 (+) Transcript_24452:70-372(+)|eukprot:CAMPEP_0175051804 /NCGR_PEP_ID=MMETSP0052_2-20121109/8010_1 /TAXON_ID=51329 ORGANISM="Polytomella parva, Strain SAG 63-3" /NCGR_SAMPLE_ID=MMETSP0052_2 /ASSEMBLY_ACC=CAM_ASM_000194 /LENGTH=100 /DNA_ID=CAMNT_0016316143 /DNA_START=42 /DNA_END=344 /DNA_ORIENTATION=-
MSSKLVKQQLQSLLSKESNTVSVTRKEKKKRETQLARKKKLLEEKSIAAKAEKTAFKRNLKFFQSTKKSSELNEELMNKLLNKGKKASNSSEAINKAKNK